MALPSNVSTGTVTGTFVDGAGNALAGSVTLTPSTAVLDASGTTIIAPASLTAVLDANGSFTITLAATDDPDLNPSGWTWGARFSLPAASITAFSFALPSGTTVDLSAAAPVPSSPGNAITKGDPGDPSIYELRGTGSPYGVVTPASSGIYYTDTAGTCGAWRWLSTGTTNTSWIVDLGDTGWRNVASFLAPMWDTGNAGGKALVRRTNNTCEMQLSVRVATGQGGSGRAGNIIVLNSPGMSIVGGGTYTIGLAGVNSSTSNLITINRAYPGNIAVVGGAGIWADGDSLGIISCEIPGTPAWPTSLPGTAA